MFTCMIAPAPSADVLSRGGSASDDAAVAVSSALLYCCSVPHVIVYGAQRRACCNVARLQAILPAQLPAFFQQAAFGN